MQMSIDQKSDLIETITKNVLHSLNGDPTSTGTHPLGIEVRDVEGSERFHIRVGGDRLKVVSYENARSKEQAEDVATRSADTVKRAFQKHYNEAFWPEGWTD